MWYSSFGPSIVSLTGLWRDLLPIASSRRWSTGGGCRCTGFHVALRAHAWRRTQVPKRRFFCANRRAVAEIWICDMLWSTCIYGHLYSLMFISYSYGFIFILYDIYDLGMFRFIIHFLLMIFVYVRLYPCLLMQCHSCGHCRWCSDIDACDSWYLVMLLEVFPAAVEPVLHRCLREPWRGTSDGSWWIIMSSVHQKILCDTKAPQRSTKNVKIFGSVCLSRQNLQRRRTASTLFQNVLIMIEIPLASASKAWGNCWLHTHTHIFPFRGGGFPLIFPRVQESIQQGTMI